MAGKRDPTLSRSPTPPPPASSPCFSKLDFILQKQSGMNNSFSSPYFCFFYSFLLSPFRFSFRVSVFLFMSLLSLISPILLAFSSWYSEHVFSFRSMYLCDLGWRHRPRGIEFSHMCRGTRCYDKNNLTRGPRGAESQSIVKFLHCLPCVCLLKWSDWLYFSNNSAQPGNANFSLWCECVYMNF